MKRTVAHMLFLLVLLCACTHTPAEEASVSPAITETPAGTALPAVAAAPAYAALSGARRYGAQQTLALDGNGLSGTIAYPLGGVQPVNDAVTSWVNAALDTLTARAAALPADEDGMRLTTEIDYDAYLYNDRFIGIRFTGACTEAVSGKTEPVFHAFNYDLEESRILALSDVVDGTRAGEVSARITEKLGWLGVTPLSGNGALTAVDMRDFVIRDDGIMWLFSADTGVVGVLLDYATLMPYLCMEKPLKTPAPGVEAPGNAVCEQQAVCLYDGVQVRTLPSRMEGETIAVANAGDVLAVLDAHSIKGWHQLLYDGGTAYVPADLVQLADAKDPYTTGYVQSAYLHVRSRASTYGELLGTMQFCEPVRIADITPIDGWYKIWFEGEIAYVLARYVSTALYPPETQTAGAILAADTETGEPRILRQTSAAIVGVGTCLTDGVIIRSAPGEKAARYGALSAGEQVYILEEECAAGWDRIFVYTAWNNGYVGYVQARYVHSDVPDGEIAR